MRNFDRVLTLIVFSVLAHLAAGADQFPVRPVQLVSGFAPGGPTDILARGLGRAMSKVLGQQVVIVNRPGAGSNIATEAVARAIPDGYTILMGSSTNAVNVTLYPRLAFNFPGDFTPVNLVATMPIRLRPKDATIGGGRVSVGLARPAPQMPHPPLGATYKPRQRFVYGL